MDVQLRVLKGTLKRGSGEDVDRFRISERHFTIGTDLSCRMVCDNATVSSHHCAINVTPAGVYVHDLASETGTFINGECIEGTQPVRDGDRLRIGAMEFQFLIARSTATPAVVPPPQESRGETPASGVNPLLPPSVRSTEATSNAEAADPRDTTRIVPSVSDTITDLEPVPKDGDPDTVDLIVDIIEEADDEERRRRIEDPSVRYMRIDPQLDPIEEEPELDRVQETLQRVKEAASRPAQKLPPPPEISGADSQDAADQALDKLFQPPKQN